jgi:hypothetical protein
MRNKMSTQVLQKLQTPSYKMTSYGRTDDTADGFDDDGLDGDNVDAVAAGIVLGELVLVLLDNGSDDEAKRRRLPPAVVAAA